MPPNNILATWSEVLFSGDEAKIIIMNAYCTVYSKTEVCLQFDNYDGSNFAPAAWYAVCI